LKKGVLRGGGGHCRKVKVRTEKIGSKDLYLGGAVKKPSEKGRGEVKTPWRLVGRKCIHRYLTIVTI